MKNLLTSVLLVCFVAAYAKEYPIANEQALRVVLKTVVAGDVIVWKDGTYTDVRINFKPDAAGADGNPIVLKAQTAGKVIFTGNSRLSIAGSYLQVEGLTFKGTCTLSNSEDVIAFVASDNGDDDTHNCRVTNCAIVGYTPSDPMINQNYIQLAGSHNEVDHCYFVGKTNQGPYLVVRYKTGAGYVSGSDVAPSSFHHIHHNYFGYRTLPSDNGGEDMRIGDSRTSFTHGFNIIEYNYFEEHRLEAEVISNKSWDNIYRFNTFINDDGALVLRHGQRCFAYGNYFYGKSGRNVSGGLRVINPNQTVFNNYLEELEGGNKDIKAPITIMSGLVNSDLNQYYPADSCVVAFNTVVSSVGPAIRVGVGNKSKGKAFIAPQKVSLIGNLVINSADNRGNATTSDEAATFGLCKDNLITNGYSSINGFSSIKSNRLVKKDGYYYAPTNDESVVIAIINNRLLRQHFQLTPEEITHFNPAWKLAKADVGVSWKL